jgi:uncharacterized membrane protein
MDSISLGLHVLFVSLLVGGEALLFFAVVPSTWLIDDEGLRRAVTRVVTTRFAVLAVVSLVGLLVTGLYQFYTDDIVPPDVRENLMDFRWGWVFTTKMTLFVVLVVLIALHGAYFGRRVRETSEAIETGDATVEDLERLRRRSLLFSVLMLVVSIALVLLGATLSNHVYTDVAI